MSENEQNIFDVFKNQMEEFDTALFSEDDTNLKQEQARALWKSLIESFNILVEEYKQQKVGNEILLKVIAKLKFDIGVNKSLLSFHESNFTAAVADYLIHPNPVEIQCTHNNAGQTFKVGVNDILVIRSRGRVKSIYLRKKFRPLEGGDEQSVIMVNKNGLDFEELLRKIQRNGNHILRIAQSYAVNIFQYELTSSNTFKLTGNPPDKFDPKLIEIKTDKLFNVGLYHERLMEIDRLSHHFKDYEVNMKKIEEINRYKNSMGIT